MYMTATLPSPSRKDLNRTWFVWSFSRVGVSEYMQGNTITNLLVIEGYMGVNNNIKMLAAVINVNGKHDDVHLKQGLVCQIMSLKTPIIK